MNTIAGRYSRLMIALHWATVILIVVAYLLSEGGRRVRTDPPLLHFTFGMAVLVLVVPRLIARLAGGVPPPIDPRSTWLSLAARIGHALLYVLLVAVPLSGWYVTSRMGIDARIAGVSLPPIAAAVAGPPGFMGNVHQLGGNSILILGGAHALAALWHHFRLRDDTLRRMIPF